MESTQNASQWLGHGGVFKGDAVGHNQHIGLNNAARNTYVFGVSAIVEEQVHAEIFLMFGAIKTHLAGGGVQCHNPHAAPEATYIGANFFNYAGQFVAKQRRGNNHASMIAALINLQIRAASEGYLDFDEYLAFGQAGYRYLFNLDVLFSVEDCGCHFSVHSSFPSHELPG